MRSVESYGAMAEKVSEATTTGCARGVGLRHEGKSMQNGERIDRGSPRELLMAAQWSIDTNSTGRSSAVPNASTTISARSSQLGRLRLGMFKNETPSLSSSSAPSSCRSANSLSQRKLFTLASRSGSRRDKSPSCASSVPSSYVETDIHGRGYCSMLVDEEEFDFEWW